MYLPDWNSHHFQSYLRPYRNTLQHTLFDQTVACACANGGESKTNAFRLSIKFSVSANSGGEQ